jgi:hypothetical protein
VPTCRYLSKFLIDYFYFFLFFYFIFGWVKFGVSDKIRANFGGCASMDVLSNDVIWSREVI